MELSLIENASSGGPRRRVPPGDEQVLAGSLFIATMILVHLCLLTVLAALMSDPVPRQNRGDPVQKLVETLGRLLLNFRAVFLFHGILQNCDWGTKIDAHKKSGVPIRHPAQNQTAGSDMTIRNYELSARPEDFGVSVSRRQLKLSPD